MSKLAIKGGQRVRTEDFHRWPVFDSGEEEAVLKALRSGHWWRYSHSSGVTMDEAKVGTRSQVRLFQEEFALHHGAKYGVACNNGTAALDMVIRALDIGIGDEVIVPAYTYIASCTCALQSNAIPIFVDIDPETYNIDPHRVEKAITERTKAVIPCHFGGQIADMDRLSEIAEKHGLYIIEDAAHAHGSEWNGKKAGSIGVAGTFSFQNSKNMTSGEGGIVITDSEDLAETVESLTWAGRMKGRPWYEFHRLGWNNRLTEFQGAILRIQLIRLGEQNARRWENAEYLTGLLNDMDGLNPVRIDPKGQKCSFHIFMMRYDPDEFKGLSREKLLEAVNAEGIPAFSGYTHALYNNPMFINKAFYAPGCPDDYSEFAEKCPVTERAVSYEAIWLEQRLFLGTRSDMNDIAEAFRKVKENIDELL
ncbi:DegT/DnrJ/EryC1/StrS family aminotransferase [Candidatus Poribacteria bacterium]